MIGYKKLFVQALQCHMCAHIRRTTTKKPVFHFVKLRPMNACIRTFKTRPSQPQQGSTSPSKSRVVQKNLLFTSLVCGGSFVGCMIWQQEKMDQKAREFEAWYEGRGMDRDGMVHPKAFQYRRDMNYWWNSMSDSKKWYCSVLAVNLVVFAMWRLGIPARVMKKYFTSQPEVNPVISNVLSFFSHYSFLHLFCNMYVFMTFVPAVFYSLGLEQSTALYLSGGVVSSFAGSLQKLIRGSQVPSLGASGAILCFFGYICTSFPESRFSIAFVSELIPHSFSAQQGLIGLMVLDTMGLILGWKVFDHAAHLGGVIFGIWYAKYGKDWIWSKRRKVQKLWKQIRNKSN